MKHLMMIPMFALFAGLTLAQQPTPSTAKKNDTPPAKKADTPAKKVDPKKEKKSPLDDIPNYKRHMIEGFTVLVSKETLDADVSKYERKPLEVLEMELKTIVKIMPAKTTDVLRKILIWIEWDQKMNMSNGRAGNALAVFQGGHQSHFVNEGMHPLKANAVTVLSMRGLTQEHQPDRDSGRCVLLHELAHAIHILMLGSENGDIKAAYKAALERKLYDKDQYVSTNDKEFFAELTCAYYDQLHHYPHNREELKAHDPNTFKLMEKIYGKDAKRIDAVAKNRPLSEINGSNEFDLGVNMKQFMLGKVLSGPSVDLNELKDKIVVFGFFGGSDKAVLTKYTALQNELAQYGIRVIVGPSYVTTPEKIVEDVTSREVTYSVLDRFLIPKTGNSLESQPAAHTLVFDKSGKCVFRGSGHQAAPHVRALIWNEIAKKIDLPDHKNLAPLHTAIKTGYSFQELLAKALLLAAWQDAEVNAPAKAFVAELTEHGTKTLEKASSMAKTEPIDAYLLAESVAAQYKGTLLAGKANSLVLQLKQTTAVASELRAKTILENIKKLDSNMMSSPGSFDPLSPRFQQEHAASLDQTKKLLDQLKKTYPKSRALDTALNLVKKYGLG